MNNTHSRDAKRIINELHNLLRHVRATELLFVAKAYGRLNKVPQKVMLKAMRRFIRLNYHN
jgi:hypothetical protein